MSEAEKEWLAKACPYFIPAYRDFLGTYRFKPEQVEIKFIPAEGTEEGPGELHAVVCFEWCGHDSGCLSWVTAPVALAFFMVLALMTLDSVIPDVLLTNA